MSIILIRSRTSQIEDLAPLADAILDALATIEPGLMVEVPPTS